MLADLENVAGCRPVRRGRDLTSAPPTPRRRPTPRRCRPATSYRRAAEAAIGLFGDIGFTQEHDTQLYYRRAWSAERLSGGPQAHRGRFSPPSYPDQGRRLTRVS